jgi:regulation of enolase protein 1 (concanavalin A-like superfamily)
MPDVIQPLKQFELAWTNPTASRQIDGDALHITAPAMTDLFTDPAGAVVKADSQRAVFTPDPQCTLAAHVTVDFKATYDAGVLLFYADAEHWAKLCFELSPQGEPMIVSVVTNGASDDCNSVPLARHDIYLRITRLGRALAFHYSEDGQYWRLVRHFALRNTDNLRIGFSSQSPTGAGCHVVFDQIQYRAAAIKDIRSGE